MGKVKLRTMLMVLLLLICVFSLIGCQTYVNGSSDADDPRMRLPALGYKSEKTVFDIDDVTLTFYAGSENAGDGYGNYQNFPTETYLYFANEKTMVSQYYPISGDLYVNNGEIYYSYAENYDPKDLYLTIESDPNISVCKKLFSSDNNAFYKKNTVTLEYQDIPYEQGKFIEEELWGKESALCKITPSYTRGIYVPKISYDFTIPSCMFSNDKGYVLFCLATFIAEEYETKLEDVSPFGQGVIVHPGELLESRIIILYYQKNEKTVVLSNYYEGGNQNA